MPYTGPPPACREPARQSRQAIGLNVLLISGDAKFGGSTYLLYEWARFLSAHNCRIDIQTTDRNSILALQTIPNVQIIDWIHIPREVAPRADLRALAGLTAHIRRARYDVVQTGMTTAGFVGRLAAWLAHAPVIVHDAQGWPVTEYSSLPARAVYTPLSYLAGWMSTRVVCAGDATAALAGRLHTSPRSKIAVIHNGIDPAPFDPASLALLRPWMRAELGLAAGELVIGNANRLAPQKDNTTLIQAMAVLAELLPDRAWKLLLAGDGPERSQLEALVHSLGLNERVRFLGFRNDIPAFLAAVDLFVNTSLWEGLSISLLEAMAAAKPIVTTAIPPNAELIDDEVTGLLVDPRAPAQVAAAIARFTGAPALAARCGTAARQRVLQHYTIERRLQATWDLYLQLVSRKEHRPVRPMQSN